MKVSPRERIASALGLIPLHCLSIALGFSPVRCVLIAFGLTPVRCVLIAFGLTPVRCEVGICCPLVASFFFVLANAKPCRECSGQWRVSPFAYEVTLQATSNLTSGMLLLDTLAAQSIILCMFGSINYHFIVSWPLSVPNSTWGGKRSLTLECILGRLGRSFVRDLSCGLILPP